MIDGNVLKVLRKAGQVFMQMLAGMLGLMFLIGWMNDWIIWADDDCTEDC